MNDNEEIDNIVIGFLERKKKDERNWHYVCFGVDGRDESTEVTEYGNSIRVREMGNEIRLSAFFFCFFLLIFFEEKS